MINLKTSSYGVLLGGWKSRELLVTKISPPVFAIFKSILALMFTTIQGSDGPRWASYAIGSIMLSPFHELLARVLCRASQWYFWLRHVSAEEIVCNGL
jgi:hypothetical protein